MKTKFLFLIAVLVMGIALTACGPSAITVQSDTQPPQRTITVSGTGLVTMIPDIATINIGVQTQDASASVAMADNTTKARAVSDAIKAAGVADKDIQTTNFSIYPQQQYDDKGHVTDIIYVVSNTVYVTVRDLAGLGGLLDASVRAGANSIDSISFDVDDKTEPLSQARLAAVENARKQADELTAAAGVSVGDVQTISYYDNSAPLTVQYSRADMAVGGGVPVEAGSMQITTTVNIVYGIK